LLISIAIHALSGCSSPVLPAFANPPVQDGGTGTPTGPAGPDEDAGVAPAASVAH